MHCILSESNESFNASLTQGIYHHSYRKYAHTIKFLIYWGILFFIAYCISKLSNSLLVCLDQNEFLKFGIFHFVIAILHVSEHCKL
jgi:hypothetical protein